MALDVKIYSGVVQTWNVVHSTTHVTYTRIEFDGGKYIGEIRATEALSDIFETALRRGEALKLHVVMPLESGPATLIAFEQPEGVMFATDVPPLPFLFQFAPRIALIIGILLIPAFGIGIVVLGVWANMRRQVRPMVELRDYVRRLPRATLV